MRKLLFTVLAIVSLTPRIQAQQAANGPFKPTDESLQQYKYPEWFRDAKFGIWSHWARRPCHGRATGTQKICI